MNDFPTLLKKLLRKSNRLVRLYYRYFLPAFLLYTILLFLSFSILFRIATSFQRVSKNPFSSYHVSTYPIASIPSTLDISALGIAVLDADSHTFIYTKNPTVRFSPASTTKIMTALITRAFWKPTDSLGLRTWEDPEGSGITLQIGEKMTVKNLLQAMLMYSANDAAFAVAQNYPGGESGFVKAMNERAKQLHLHSSQFGDPAGLDDNQNYTTPEDMIELASVAMRDALLSKIVMQKSASIADVSGTIPYLLTNRNILLGTDGVTGIKTGFTDEAKEVLVTRVQKNNHTFYLVVMKSDDRFGDTQKIIEKIITATSFVSIHH